MDVVDFGPGEPDFPTPEHIKQAAIKALEENRTKYTATPASRRCAKPFATGTAANSASLVSAGRMHRHRRRQTRASSTPLVALINSGDEVIIPAPYWVSYPDIVKIRRRQRPSSCPLARKTVSACAPPTVEKAHHAAHTHGDRQFAQQSHRRGDSAGGVRAHSGRLPRHGIWLLTDECYSHFTYGGAKPFSVASLPDSKDRADRRRLALENFCDDRLAHGLCARAEPLVDAMTKLQSQSTSNPTFIAQYAALEALRGPMDSVARCSPNTHAAANVFSQACARFRELLAPRRKARSTCSRMSPRICDSTCAGHDGDGAEQLLEREHVAVVPGDAFGAPGYICAFRTPLRMERIEEGLRRLTRFFGRAAQSDSLPGASGADFQSAPLGLALSRAAIPGKNKPRRAARRSLDDGQRLPVCLRPVRGREARDGWPTMPAEWTGTLAERSGLFPLLVKFIFAEDKLSVQVHPDDEYARHTRTRHAGAEKRRCGMRYARGRAPKCLWA